MQRWFEQFWHGRLGKPYRLSKPYDTGDGPGVILLHGIGRSGRVWSIVEDLLKQSAVRCRVVSYDLLGFGSSPKPDQIEYTVDDHAASVIDGIRRLRGSKPVILVGHSMGCLVAVRVARLRPDLVRHLVLYEMPLYEGLPEKWRYQARINVYYRFYEWVSRQNPTFDDAKQRMRQRIATKVVGADIGRASWQPFVKSLKNTIMKQTADEDLPLLRMPSDIIYGSRDMLVIRGKVQKIFGLDSKLVTTHTIKESHVLSAQASAFLVDRIKAALSRAS